VLEISFSIQQTKGGATLETTYKYPAMANSPERVRTTKKQLRNTRHKDAVEKAVMLCHVSIAAMFGPTLNSVTKPVTWTIHYKPAK
jgi:hypothetical protein